jgi:hypothetical protein
MTRELATDMHTSTSKLMRLRQQPLASVLFWLLLVVLWGILELAWRWRRLRARIQ